MTDHPITPPPELFRKWAQYQDRLNPEALWRTIAIQAARWGADQELEACCEWAAEVDRDLDKELRAARRPKPPSLKEQALDGLQRIETNIPQSLKEFEASCDVIRRALEQLDD